MARVKLTDKKLAALKRLRAIRESAVTCLV
jgi:hypothetical protein